MDKGSVHIKMHLWTPSAAVIVDPFSAVWIIEGLHN